MLKRKFFIKYENETNEQFEKRLNQFAQKDDQHYHKDDNIGHNVHISNDGNTMLVMFYHAANDESEKQKIGF